MLTLSVTLRVYSIVSCSQAERSNFGITFGLAGTCTGGVTGGSGCLMTFLGTVGAIVAGGLADDVVVSCEARDTLD